MHHASCSSVYVHAHRITIHIRIHSLSSLAFSCHKYNYRIPSASTSIQTRTHICYEFMRREFFRSTSCIHFSSAQYSLSLFRSLSCTRYDLWKWKINRVHTHIDLGNWISVWFLFVCIKWNYANTNTLPHTKTHRLIRMHAHQFIRFRFTQIPAHTHTEKRRHMLPPLIIYANTEWK